MAIRVVCPHCDAAFSVADELRGKKVRCRECEKPVPVVAAKPKKTDDEDDEREERVQAKPRKAAPAPARPRDDDDARAARRRPKRYDDDEDDDDIEEDRPTLKKKKSSATPMIVAAVGGGVVLVGGIVGLVLWLNREPDKTAENTPAKMPVGPQGGAGGQGGGPGMMGQGGGGMMGAGMMGGQAGGMMGGQAGGMMGGMQGKAGPDAPPEMVVAGGRENIQDLRQRAVRELDPTVRKKIEDSTVYILFLNKENEKEATFGASGSGFLAFEPGIVLTNAHVVDMLEPGSEEPESLSVVVHSGTPEEKKLKGKVLGVDRVSDLAVVRVDPTGLPPPLAVRSSSGLHATQPVYVCGFPLGKSVSNQVTIFQGQVASLSVDPESKLLKRVVLASEMQHGNSGGPVVDDKGDVVGVNVAGIEGTRINFAVPGDYVSVIVNGRISRARTGACFRSLGHVNVPVTLDVVNPLSKIDKIEAEVWTGDEDPKYSPPPSFGKRSARPNDSASRRFPLDLKDDHATGDFVIPDDLPSGKAYWWQPVITYKNGTVQWISGKQYTREEPLERRQTLIAYKTHHGQRKLNLTIHQRFVLDDRSGRQLHIDTDVTGELVENEEPVAADKKSPMRVVVSSFNIVPKKDSPPLRKEIERALNHTSFLDIRMQIDERGDVIDPKTFIIKGCPPDVVGTVGRYGDLITKALHSVAVPLSNRHILHHATWEATRPLSVVTTRDVEDAKMDVAYKYLGRRVRDGREEALIEMSGKLSKKKTKTGAGGALEGRALVDLATGTITMARATVTMDIDLALEGLPLRSRGTLEVVLERELPK